MHVHASHQPTGLQVFAMHALVMGGMCGDACAGMHVREEGAYVRACTAEALGAEKVSHRCSRKMVRKGSFMAVFWRSNQSVAHLFCSIQILTQVIDFAIRIYLFLIELLL
uniref:Uncharacterized protein n=1 Tax=Micrurus lemniscatus lemniscatus TaxID=129467 RepID=A0A2D4H9W8_MICLE